MSSYIDLPGDVVKQIQLDMYAVGLGAAILTQVRLPGGDVVSLLADGGMGPGGYPARGVHDRIGDAFVAFGNGGESSRIDLIVGTHYDSDHLKGLIPIAADNAIDIGDVWLPPVKDDTDDIPGHVSESADYLAIKFYEDGDGEELMRYLDAKRLQVEDLKATEMRVVGLLREQGSVDELPRYRLSAAREFGAQNERRPETLEDYIKYFRHHESEAAALTDSDGAHGSSRYDSMALDLRDLARDARSGRGRDTWARIERYEGYLKEDPATTRMMPVTLALVRKSTAAGAITATYLHQLVQALKARNTPVRPTCHYITAGEPARFTWHSAKRRFVLGDQDVAGDLTLTLLGPSDLLVEKHREKLPVGSYLFALVAARSRIALEGITESNQLSYIFTLEAAGQRILISGDSGCYGFKDEDGNYWGDLLEALRTLHVVQVAHHAGHNYDFYNTLLAAGFGQQESLAYLLISHAVRDPKRPSDAFAQFIAKVRRRDESPLLLFTSEPLATKVRDFDELFAPQVSAAGRADQGDVRMSYSSGAHSDSWIVEKHSVAPP